MNDSQLDDITESRMTVRDGKAIPSNEPGIGIAWDLKAIEKKQRFTPIVVS
jgi:L-alanine-DL-glutamate epimerase-like enolase superfamily enzyme